MTTRARTNKKMNVHPESLEAREAPTVGLAGAWQAALAQAQSVSHSGFHPRMRQLLLLSRPGSTSQSPAGSPGDASNANGGVSQARTNPMLALIQARQARLAAIQTARPMSNRPLLQAAFARRGLMRSPLPASPPNAPTAP